MGDKLISNIRIRLYDAPPLKAFCSCVIANAVELREMRILDGRNGLFVAAPSKPRKNDSSKYDNFYQPTKEFSEEFQATILAQYQAALNA